MLLIASLEVIFPYGVPVLSFQEMWISHMSRDDDTKEIERFPELMKLTNSTDSLSLRCTLAFISPSLARLIQASLPFSAYTTATGRLVLISFSLYPS